MPRFSTLVIYSFIAAITFLEGCSQRPSTQSEMVPDLVTTKEIASGTTIENSDALFKTGTLYYKDKKPGQGPGFQSAPPDNFPGNMVGIIKGKKVSRDLKAGEVVKLGDIVEPDGSPFKEP